MVLFTKKKGLSLMEHDISLRERIRLNLVAAMERAGINQVQLAKKLGISKGTVNNWIRGNNSPDVDIVPDVCSVLGISIIELFSSLNNSVVGSPGLNLSSDEIAILLAYRHANDDDRAIVNHALNKYIEPKQEKTVSAG